MVNKKIQRGGVANDDVIDFGKVLGDNFKLFATQLGTSKISDFTFDKLSPGNLNSKYKKNDVDFKFTEAVMLISAAFAQIERPNIENYKTTSGIGDKLSELFEQYINGTDNSLSPVPTAPFDFVQLPYSDRLPNLENSMFNLIPYGKMFKSYGTGSENMLDIIIRYLYHYIALLDVGIMNNSHVENMFTFLKQDNILFMPVVNEFVNNITTSDYFDNINIFDASDPAKLDQIKSEIKDTVMDSLKGVAYAIITKYKNTAIISREIYKKSDFLADDNFFKNTKDLKEVLKESGILKINDTLAKRFYNSVNAYDPAPGTDAKLAEPTNFPEDQIKRINKLAYYNPFYITNKNIKKSLDDDEYKNVTNNKTPAEMIGGGEGMSFGSSSTGTGSGIVSLPLFYGPKIDIATDTDNGNHNLITKKKQGVKATNADFVSKTAVKSIYDEADKKSFIMVIKEYAGKYITKPGDINETSKIAVILGMLYFSIDSEKDLADLIAADQHDEAAESIEKTLRSFNQFVSRTSVIPAHGRIDKNLREMFVNTFIRELSKKLSLDNGKIVKRIVDPAAQPVQPVNKSTLIDDKIWKFYKDHVIVDPDFYSKFFNLMKYDSNNKVVNDDIDLKNSEAKNIIDADRGKYRLNVKKVSGYVKDVQIGGASSFGDIMFVSLLPYYDTSVGKIWISPDIFIPDTDLTPDVIKYLSRETYNLYLYNNDIVVFGKTISKSDFINFVQNFNHFMGNSKDFYNNFINRISADASTISPDVWRENEIFVSEQVLSEANRWKRVPGTNKFVKYDEDGKEVEVLMSDNCAFIKNDTRKCLAFLHQCLTSTTKADYEKFCDKLLNFSFNITPDLNFIRDEVQKMNPVVAFQILRYFGFGYRLVTEDYPIKDFNRYKVQTVGEWLDELMSGVDKCAPINNNNNNNVPFQCGTLKQRLGKLADQIITMSTDRDKRGFFNYLDILVNWVNANHQVLNPAENETGITGISGNYPKISDGYKLYKYAPPYKTAEIRSRVLGYACGLERLRSDIMNELNGTSSKTTISNISSVPFGTEMPLTHYGFTTRIPMFANHSQFGGVQNILDTGYELKKLNQPVGYTLFNDIFTDLTRTMQNSLGKDRMQLTNKSFSDIRQKLDRLKDTEIELRKSLIDLIERNKLYQATHGYVDTFSQNSKDFKTLQEKHSNLINLGNAYSRRSVNIIELFQTVANAIVDKIDKSSPQNTSQNEQQSLYDRPISMGYIGKKKN